jgi:hypothetical protein
VEQGRGGVELQPREQIGERSKKRRAQLGMMEGHTLSFFEEGEKGLRWERRRESITR